MASTLPATTFHQPSDAVDLGEVGSLLRRRLGLIAFFVLGMTLCAVLYVMFATPQFTARGALYLGDAPTTGGGGGGDDGGGMNLLTAYSNQSDVETQIELITAGTLVQNAVLETGLNTQMTPAGAPPMTFWRWKYRFGAQTSAFLPGPTTLQALYASTPGNYRVVLGKNGTYTLYARSTWFKKPKVVLRGVLGSPASGGGAQMLLEPATANFQGQPGEAYDLKVQSPAALADGLIGGALTVTAGGSVAQPTDIAFLQFRWHDPYQAQTFINQMMQDYIATQLSWKTQAASTTEDFVKTQLAQVSGALSKADQELAAYQSNAGIVDVTDDAQAAINQLGQYETQRSALEIQRVALQQLDDELHKSTGPLNPYLISQTNDQVLASLTSSLSDAEVKLNELLVQYTEGAEQVRIENAEIAKLEDSIKTITRNDLAAANMNLASLDSIIAKFQGKIKAMPAESLKVSSLKRSTDVLGQLYVLLMEKEEQAQVSKAATIINTRIVTPADFPLYATSPRETTTIVFGAFAGLIVGIGLVFGQRALSGKFETEDQIRNSVQLPVFAAVPRQPRTQIAADIFGGDTRNAFSESFRLLRGTVYQLSEQKKAMIILIISACKEDGKTTVSANLAKILADDEQRVALVDGDLHLGRLQALLNLGVSRGLTDWLSTGVRPAMPRWPGQNFSVLPAGLSRRAGREQLNKGMLSKIFSTLSEEFDYIIIDSPPLPTVSDGMTFAAFADLILSVVSVSRTPRRMLKLHNDLIDSMGRPHGIVINEVESRQYDDSDAYFLADTVRRARISGWSARN